MSTEVAESEDYVLAFAKKHGLDPVELRACIACGPRFVRQYLADEGIYDAYPRRRAPGGAPVNNSEMKP